MSYVEVVGGFLCSLEDLAILFPSADAAERADIRTAAEQRLESAIGYACVPRYAWESRFASGSWQPHWPKVRTIRSLSVNGTAYEAGTLLSTFSPYGDFDWSYGAAQVRGHVVIGYEHGLDYPGEGVRQATLLAAKETYRTTNTGSVVRREADGQAITYASPSSSGGFLDTVLRSMVKDASGAVIG